MRFVSGAAQVVMLHDKEHVPMEPPTHVAYRTGGNVRINVNAWLPTSCINARAKLRRECTHRSSGNWSELWSLSGASVTTFCVPGLPLEFPYQRVTLVHKPFAIAPTRFGSNGIFAEQWKCNGGI